MKTEIIHDLVKTSVQLCLLFFGIWCLIITTFPYNVIPPVLCMGLMYLIRIPPPDINTVEEILGKDLSFKSNDFAIKSVAHRGAGLDAPENSIAAFDLSLKNGINAVELDVTLTSDGIPVVFHDTNLLRIANINLTINKTKWMDLKHVDISVNHPFKAQYSNTVIPTLDESVKHLLSNGQRIFLDLKDFDKKMVDVVIAIYKKYPELYKKAVVTSFFPNLIYLIRRRDPKIVGCLAHRMNIFSMDFHSYLGGNGTRRYKAWYKHYIALFIDYFYNWAFTNVIYYLLGISVVLLHKDMISGNSITHWQQRGIRVMVYPVNTPIGKQFYAHNLKITYLTDTVTGENSTHNSRIHES